jgi:hypothetical protein
VFFRRAGGGSSGLSGGGVATGGIRVSTSRGGVQAMRVHSCSGSLLWTALLVLLLSTTSTRVRFWGVSSGLSNGGATIRGGCVRASRGGVQAHSCSGSLLLPLCAL